MYYWELLGQCVQHLWLPSAGQYEALLSEIQGLSPHRHTSLSRKKRVICLLASTRRSLCAHKESCYHCWSWHNVESTNPCIETSDKLSCLGMLNCFVGPLEFRLPPFPPPPPLLILCSFLFCFIRAICFCKGRKVLLYNFSCKSNGQASMTM